jgi:hypothetical protein
MSPHRGNAITAGVLLIACTALSILSVAPLGNLLDTPVDLAELAAHDNRVVLAALIEFIAAAAGVGIAVALYPVLRPHNPALALGSVAARLASGVLVLVGTLGLLGLLALGQDALTTGPDGSSTVQAATSMLLAVRTWAPLFLAALAFQLGAAMYYWLMYRGRLVPRWLSGWGLAAIALSLVATLYTALTTQDFGLAGLETALNIPLALQEMVLAGWLIAKGFTPPTPAPGSEPAPELQLAATTLAASKGA